jgi:phospholipid/cholesterol/gamma-HCH transport system substrate-binding protein
VGVLLHDENAAADLQRTLKNLRVSSKELSDDLEALQHNFLLRGFFKKKEKEQ